VTATREESATGLAIDSFVEAAEPGAFVTFLRDERQEILREWERRVRALPPAADLGAQTLIDHMPQILDDLAEAAEAALEGTPRRAPKGPPDQHALARLNQGYELGHVVTEYALLRETILDVSAQDPRTVTTDLRVFNRVLDGAITQAVQRYQQASQRMPKALDRISLLAFVQKSESELLHTLLSLMMEACPGVDEVTLLIAEGGRLYVRASVGITSERDADFSLAVGEGFSGRVAERKQPLFLRSAETDPLVESAYLRERHIKALYGVPLIDGPELIGVAHMGSVTAYEFPDEDMFLFRAMTNRASQLLIETRLKRKIDAQAHELELVLTAADVGSFNWDPDRRELGWDRRTRKMFGVSEDETITYQRFFEMVAPADREPLERTVRRTLESGGEYRARYQIICPNGEVRFIAARGAITQIGRQRRFLGIVQDRTEEEYAERERELFLAALGHDLRNPLGAINLAATSLLRHESLPEAARTASARIASSSERMARLIDQLLSFARRRAGEPIELNRQRVDLVELWHQVLDEIALAEQSRKLILENEGDTFGRWDPDRMLQVFQNLAWNAVQYGEASEPILIHLSGEPERVVIEVHNRGIPIPPDLLPVLFDPFRRGRRGSGLGIGLYIAKQIVEAHGGTIAVVESTIEAGTRFRVVLPRSL
jgi:PAS domain S-box-containing protein